MGTYSIDRLSIEPQEAIDISRRMTYTAFYGVLGQLLSDVRNLIPYKEIMGSKSVHAVEICAAIWTAGRVQGIREERARRRKQHLGMPRDLYDAVTNIAPEDRDVAIRLLEAMLAGKLDHIEMEDLTT